MHQTTNMMSATPPAPPRTPAKIPPRFELLLPLPLLLPVLETGTTVVGVITAVEVLRTIMTDPPGRVELEEKTDREVTGGRVDVEEAAEVEDWSEEGGMLLLLSDEHAVEKSVAVADVCVIGTVVTRGIWVVTT